jgi:hypothetical protein
MTVIGHGYDDNVGAPAFRNRITNGNMRVSQRGTSFSFPAGGGTNYYPVDRFHIKDYTWSSGSNITVSNDTTVYPSSFTNSLKVATGATGLTFASGGWLGITQKIEGYNISDLYNKSITLSFWVRSSVTGTYSVSFTNTDVGVVTPDRAYVAAYTINAANTWEFKTITTSLATATASGTWNTTTGIGLHVEWGLGSNANRRTDTYNSDWTNWSSIGWQRTTQTQWASTANATFYITGVQLEAGPVATPFEFEPFETTLRKCQRYFEKTYDLGTAIGAATANGSLGNDFMVGADHNGYIAQRIPFFITKRITNGTLTVYDNAGNAGKVTKYTASGAGINNITPTISDISERAFRIYIVSQTCVGFTTHYTISAEL